MLFTIVIFIAVLSVLVFAHEAGHFFTARRLGVKAEEFGLGFPPRAIGWYQNQAGHGRLVWGNKKIEQLQNNRNQDLIPGPQNTVYSLNWLPLGGFVKIKGEDGEEKEATNSFASKRIWQRVLILSAGVIMNILLAWFLFSWGYLIGMPQSRGSLGPQAHITQSQVMVAQVLPNSPASRAGLKDGDLLLEVNHIQIKNEKTLQDVIASRANQKTVLVIKRGGQEQTVQVEPQAKNGQRALIGVGISYSGLVSYPFWWAIWEGLKTTGWLLGQIFISLWLLVAELFRGQSVTAQFAGPIGIANITGQAARLGFSYLLQFTALLSLNLAVINILPFPALDGGRILFLIIEKFKGKPVRRETENLIHNIGFLLLMVLILFVTYKDIIRLF